MGCIHGMGKLEPHAHKRQAYYHLFQDKFLPMGSAFLLSVFLPFLQRNRSAALKAVANYSSPQTQNKQIKQAKMISHQEGEAGIQITESELQVNERNSVNSKANKWQQVNICSGTGAADWFWTLLMPLRSRTGLHVSLKFTFGPQLWEKRGTSAQTPAEIKVGI